MQGAPGTGKTAVGLHRAAYLLYLHRERLRRSGVLVVGPNRAFLRYISAVLPALGEIEVEQATVDDLIARVPVRGTDPADVAALKHDAADGRRCCAGRSGRAHRQADRRPIVVSDGSYRWRIARRGAAPDRRRRAAREPAVRDRPRTGPGPRGGAAAAPGRGAPGRLAAARRGCAGWRATAPVRGVPRRASGRRSTPEELVFGLLSDPAVLAAAADGVLTADEQERAGAGRSRPGRSKAARWSAPPTPC